MAIESVALGSNVIPFPTARAAAVRRERAVEVVIGAESLGDIRLASDADDELLLLVAGRLWLDAVQRATGGDVEPRVVTIDPEGRLDVLATATLDEATLGAGTRLACVIGASCEQGRIAYRLRESLREQPGGHRRHG